MKHITDSLTALSAKLTAPLERLKAEIAFAEKLAAAYNNQEWKDLIAEAVKLAASSAETEIAAKAAECEKLLAPIGEAAKKHTIHLLGHAHIDMNWTWSTLETVTVCHDTFTTLLKLMDEYPDFVFAQSQVSVYKYIKEYYPELMPKIIQRIKEGRWEVTAACWTEIDDNLISGESFCRNLLYSKKWMKDNYGIPYKDIRIDWKADTFGHAWTLPALMKEGGVTEFYHMRPGGQHWLSRWEAPDGSQVLEFDDGKGCYVAPVAPAMADTMIDYWKETGLRDFLYIFGVGDHGGGPTRQHLNAALDMMTWPIFPSIRFSSSAEYFDIIRQKQDQIPVHKDEINYIFRGCYTSQSKVKRINRKAENIITEAETVCALTEKDSGLSYPYEHFRKAWEHTMYNQFHDILAGSSEHNAMEDADFRFRETEALTGTAKHRALRNIAGKLNTLQVFADIPWDNSGIAGGFGEVRLPGGTTNMGGTSSVSDIFMVYNPTAKPKTEVVRTKLWNKAMSPDRIAVKDNTGKITAAQVIGSSQYVEHTAINIAFTAENVPAFGYKTYAVYESDCPIGEKAAEYHPNLFTFLPAAQDSKGVRQTSPFAMENQFVSIEIDPATGGLKHYINKATGTDYVPQGRILGYLELFTEVPHFMTSWFTAQEFKSELLSNGRLVDDNDPGQSFDGDILSMVASRRIPMRGPLTGSIRTMHSIGNSKVITEIVLNADSPYVNINIEARWREIGDATRGVPVLKLVLPCGSSSSKAVYEIPNGYTERPQDSEDVPALRWVSVLDDTKGMTLINDSKSGFSVNNGVLKASLIRSSYDPDQLPELGQHQIGFRLVPNEGAFNPSAAIDEAEIFAKPLTPVPAALQEGILPAELSYCELLSGTVQITAIKKAEEENAVIIRMWETGGQNTQAVLRFEGAAEAEFCNTLEEASGKKAAVNNGIITVDIPAFATRSIKIRK